MLTINEPMDLHVSNILKGLAILLEINSKAKVMSHNGAIDLILDNNKYTTEQYRSLTILGWLELSDYSWRYWIASSDLRLGEKKQSPWITLAGKYENDGQYDEVLTHIAEYRKELDEEVGRYYDEEYQIVEEKMYDY